MAKEEARETGIFEELSEDEAMELEQALHQLSRKTEQGERPLCKISYFVPDEQKEGGKTVAVKETVKHIKQIQRKIVLMKKNSLAGTYEEIKIDRIVQIAFEETEE